jgi:hypothetical protein
MCCFASCQDVKLLFMELQVGLLESEILPFAFLTR